MNFKNISIAAIVLILVIFFSWLLFFQPEESHEGHMHNTEKLTEVWTCSMHPQIKKNKAGKCPICAMDLVPLETIASDDDNTTDIQMSKAAIALANIQTIVIKKGNPIKEIHLQGKIHVDQRRISEISARFGGRIEELFVNFTGQEVKKGELLAKIYSPELITAQKELLEAAKDKGNNTAMYKAAVSKLKLWDITERQINNIENSGKIEMFFNIISTISGTVSMLNVQVGDYVKQGTTLIKIIDLSHLWVMFDAYERDLPWIKIGDNIKYEINALPGENFSGKISYIDPFINEKTRVAKVRVELNNIKKNIKPQMFAKGIIESKISLDEDELIIPKSSILWTGKRAIVYVKEPNKESPTFSYREIILGSDVGSSYIVKKGLREGEEIAINGVFKIDAAAQLTGLNSMMNPLPSKTIEVNEKFRKQLTSFYKDYLKLKDAFISSDYKETSKTILLLKSSIGKIDMTLLNGDAHIKWMKNKKELDKTISEIIKAKDIISQRIFFADLSNYLFNTIKEFGIDQVTYYQFCPMASNNKGAYWLSETDIIRNPYFGEEMLECGETKETIK